jgi:hypothetical protein
VRGGGGGAEKQLNSGWFTGALVTL